MEQWGTIRPNAEYKHEHVEHTDWTGFQCEQFHSHEDFSALLIELWFYVPLDTK